MSVSFSAELVAGALYQDLYKKEIVKREVTRYNETTGKPYQKQLLEVKHHLGNMVFTQDEWDTFVDGVNESRGREEDTLQFFYGNSEGGPIIFGVPVVEVSSGKLDVMAISQELIRARLALAEKLLEPFGVASGVVDPGAFLWLVPSYG
jgi:hypothetical protein